MLHVIKKQVQQPAQEKTSTAAIQAPPYKVYANIERLRDTQEVHLEVIDGFLCKPESLAFSHAELLAGGIFCIHLSIIETENYSTYYRSEKMELPALASSLMVRVHKNSKLAGLQHINFEGEILV